MKPGSGVCGDCHSGQFRLPGREGVGLYLRSGVALDEAGKARLGVDVAVLTPGEWVSSQSRPAAGGFTTALAEFFTAAAQATPEQTPQFHDPDLGLRALVVAAGNGDVELAISTEGPARTVTLTTSRAVLDRAAREVRVLEAVQPSGKK